MTLFKKTSSLYLVLKLGRVGHVGVFSTRTYDLLCPAPPVREEGTGGEEVGL